MSIGEFMMDYNDAVEREVLIYDRLIQLIYEDIVAAKTENTEKDSPSF